MNSRLLSGDDEDGVKNPPKPGKKGPMQTDPTEADVPSIHDSGFTQAWNTVGAGALNTRVRESSAEGSVWLCCEAEC